MTSPRRGVYRPRSPKSEGTWMSEAVVLLSHPMLAPVQQPLEAQGLAVARRWELSDAERAQVRAIVHAGEVVLTPDFLESLPRLGLIACVSVGYDRVDVGWCRAGGGAVAQDRESGGWGTGGEVRED